MVNMWCMLDFSLTGACSRKMAKPRYRWAYRCHEPDCGWKFFAYDNIDSFDRVWEGSNPIMCCQRCQSNSVQMTKETFTIV
eukprot:g28215.t1